MMQYIDDFYFRLCPTEDMCDNNAASRNEKEISYYSVTFTVDTTQHLREKAKDLKEFLDNESL